jgi:hypothetical protein
MSIAIALALPARRDDANKLGMAEGSLSGIGASPENSFGIANVTSEETASVLNLPAPRIWKPKHLAEFLGVSIHWIYKRTETSAEDPIPRIPGVGRLSFDTHSPAFQRWMGRQLGLR